MLARLCVVQSGRGAQRVLECREEVFKRLAMIIDGGRHENARARQCSPVVAEGLVGGALAIVYKRLLTGDREPLSGLLGDLMGMIVLPYLGPAAARQQRTRPAPASAPAHERREGMGLMREDPLAGVPMRLTYRTARVLATVASNTGASNRWVADRAGISDQGQVSKLLARLERLGLLANTGEGHTKGEPNAWRLTDLGARVTQSIGVNGRYQGRTA